MAQIDTSIYGNMQQFKLPDYIGADQAAQQTRLRAQQEQQQAIETQNLQKEQQFKTALTESLSRNAERGPDGSIALDEATGLPKVNHKAVALELTNAGFGDKAADYVQRVTTAQRDAVKTQADAAKAARVEKDAARSSQMKIHDQLMVGLSRVPPEQQAAAYTRWVGAAKAKGEIPGDTPDEFDPAYVAMHVQKQISPEKAAEFGFKGQGKLEPVPGAAPGTMYNPATGAVTNLPGVEPKKAPLKVSINNKDRTRTVTDADGNTVTDDLPPTPGQQAAIEGQTQSAVAAAKKARSDIDTLISPPKGQPGLDSATGMWGKASNLWSQATDSPTDAAIVRDRVGKVVATTTMNYMLALKAAGLGVTAFDTDKAAQMLKDAAAQVTFKDPEETKRQLLAIKELGDAQLADVNRARLKAGLEPIAFDGSTAPKADAPAKPAQKVITMAQVKQAAASYGKSVEQVMKDAQAKGFVIR